MQNCFLKAFGLRLAGWDKGVYVCGFIVVFLVLWLWLRSSWMNVILQKHMMCVLYHFMHYMYGLWLLPGFPWLFSEEVVCNSWQCGSLSSYFKKSLHFKMFLLRSLQNWKTIGKDISSCYQLPSKCKNTNNCHRKQ